MSHTAPPPTESAAPQVTTVSTAGPPTSAGTPTSARPATTGGPTIAQIIQPITAHFFGDEPPVRLEFWDGSSLAGHRPHVTIRFMTPEALTRVIWSPNELGLARAYVAGELEVDGDLFDLIAALRATKSTTLGAAAKSLLKTVAAARRLDVLHRPLAPPPQEARLHGWRHSRGRDSNAIQHHYDVGNDFYRTVLGPTMTYSCARFSDEGTTLDEAQTAKHDLICRKLGLHERPVARLLDVGCGWGSMAIHAAATYGTKVVGITISRSQAARARQRVNEAGMSALVDIRLQDYRDLAGEQFDAISSIGMSEHVGHDHLDRYFHTLRSVLAPHGRLLNHAISTVGGSKLSRASFVAKYVFPDGELIDVGRVVLAMEGAGFEVRDVESLREHYARTLRAWVANLDAQWDEAVQLSSLAQAKIWKLYMTGSAVGFEDGGIALHQVLGVAADSAGDSAMPATRRGWG